MKTKKYTSYILYILSIIIVLSGIWIMKYFDNPTFEQILYHIYTPIKGTDLRIIFDYCFFNMMKYKENWSAPASHYKDCHFLIFKEQEKRNAYTIFKNQNTDLRFEDIFITIKDDKNKETIKDIANEAKSINIVTDTTIATEKFLTIFFI